MRYLLIASLSSLCLATASLSGCASENEGTDEGGSTAAPIEDVSASARLVGDYRSPGGGYPRLLLEADGSYVYDTGVRCVRAPCPSGDAGRWQLDEDGRVRLISSEPDTLEPPLFAAITSDDPVTLLVETTSGETSELAQFVEPTLVGDYHPRDGVYPQLLLEADGSYVYDTGVRCVRAPCPSGDAGRWHLGADGTIHLVATTPDSLEPQRSIPITSNDPPTLLVEDASGAEQELTQIVEATPATSCAAVLCAVDTQCEVIDGVARCIP